MGAHSTTPVDAFAELKRRISALIPLLPQAASPTNFSGASMPQTGISEQNAKPIIWSSGGGTQSAAIAVLIAQGKLPIAHHEQRRFAAHGIFLCELPALSGQQQRNCSRLRHKGRSRRRMEYANIGFLSNQTF
jgi:hypothetical protein